MVWITANLDDRERSLGDGAMLSSSKCSPYMYEDDLEVGVSLRKTELTPGEHSGQLQPQVVTVISNKAISDQTSDSTAQWSRFPQPTDDRHFASAPVVLAQLSKQRGETGETGTQTFNMGPLISPRKGRILSSFRHAGAKRAPTQFRFPINISCWQSHGQISNT